MNDSISKFIDENDGIYISCDILGIDIFEINEMLERNSIPKHLTVLIKLINELKDVKLQLSRYQNISTLELPKNHPDLIFLDWFKSMGDISRLSSILEVDPKLLKTYKYSVKCRPDWLNRIFITSHSLEFFKTKLNSYRRRFRKLPNSINLASKSA